MGVMARIVAVVIVPAATSRVISNSLNVFLNLAGNQSIIHVYMLARGKLRRATREGR